MLECKPHGQYLKPKGEFVAKTKLLPKCTIKAADA